MVELIAMLTHQDLTVSDARAVFAASVEAPTGHWGFKDTGLVQSELAALATDMKQAGKVVHFESLEEDEERCLAAASFAAEHGLDYLIGMAFHPSVLQLLHGAGVGYLPTCGQRSGLPRMLHGRMEAIVTDAALIRAAGADGLSLSLYRWTGGQPAALARPFLNALAGPVVITGSINSPERLDEIRRLRPWGVTIGSALFDDAFAAGSFADGLAWVHRRLTASGEAVTAS